MKARTVYARTEDDDDPVPPRYRKGIVVDVLADKRRCTFSHHLDEIVRRTGMPTDAALDLFVLAASVYVADKRTKRSAYPDAWTRTFDLSSPVHGVGKWRGELDRLAGLLQFLTGDEWKLNFRWRTGEVVSSGPTEPRRFEAVCLFSGGLDSLAGAINLLAATRGRVLLVAHHDGGQIVQVQKGLAQRLADHFGASRVELASVLGRPTPRDVSQEFPLVEEQEVSTRSRSLLFLAFATAAASACGPGVPIWIPENAYIGINVPLTGARVGSLSTRTTHPLFLYEFTQILRAIGIANPVHNPFEGLTKGEVLARAKRRDLLERLAPDTISCAHPEANRWNADSAKRPFGNCGYCYPCLERRAAMNKVGWDRSSGYAYDVLRDVRLFERGSGKGGDTRAVIGMLRRANRSPLAVLRGGRLPPGTDLAATSAMYERGTAELATLFDGATSRVRRYTDVASPR